MNNFIAYASDDNIRGIVSCPKDGIKNLTDFINFFTCALMNTVVPLLVALAVVAFIYGIIQYFLYSDNEEKRKAGKNYIIWGIIALFVMTSIWGLVAIFSGSFLGNTNPVIPHLPDGK